MHVLHGTRWSNAQGVSGKGNGRRNEHPMRLMPAIPAIAARLAASSMASGGGRGPSTVRLVRGCQPRQRMAVPPRTVRLEPGRVLLPGCRLFRRTIHPVPGYRWHYSIAPESGAAFELYLGRFFGRARLELAFAKHTNDTRQMFTGIAYLDSINVDQSCRLPRLGTRAPSGLVRRTSLDGPPRGSPTSGLLSPGPDSPHQCERPPGRPSIRSARGGRRCGPPDPPATDECVTWPSGPRHRSLVSPVQGFRPVNTTTPQIRSTESPCSRSSGHHSSNALTVHRPPAKTSWRIDIVSASSSRTATKQPSSAGTSGSTYA